jgi:hypothetical protein
LLLQGELQPRQNRPKACKTARLPCHCLCAPTSGYLNFLRGEYSISLVILTAADTRKG